MSISCGFQVQGSQFLDLLGDLLQYRLVIQCHYKVNSTIRSQKLASQIEGLERVLHDQKTRSEQNCIEFLISAHLVEIHLNQLDLPRILEKFSSLEQVRVINVYSYDLSVSRQLFHHFREWNSSADSHI